jgi:hypothetical protein
MLPMRQHHGEDLDRACELLLGHRSDPRRSDLENQRMPRVAGSESDFLTDFRVARELTRESDGSVPLGDLSLPRISWLEGLDLIGAWL